MTKYIILTSGRSGSNYLTNQLNNHPNIFNYGEVLGRWTLPYKLMSRFGFFSMTWSRYIEVFLESRSMFFLAQIFACYMCVVSRSKSRLMRWKNVTAIGIKEFGFNFHDCDIDDFFRRHPDVCVVNLFRKNALRRMLSVKTLQATGVVANKSNAKRRTNDYQKINIDLVTFESDIGRIEEVVSMQMSMVEGLKEQQVLNICYEDLFSTKEKTKQYTNEVLEFLGVPSMPLESDHRRMSQEKLEDMIENYDELYAYCKGTKYEVYFD